MKRYYNEAETPLKFHKVYHYLVMPYTCLTGLFGLFDYAIYADTLTNLQYADLGFLVAFTVLGAIIFLGFYSLSGYAWYCVMAFLGLKLLRPLIAICITLLTYPDQVLSSLSYWATDLIISPLIALYYIKRKPLFFQPKPVPSPKPVVTPIAQTGEHSSPLQGTVINEAEKTTDLPCHPEPAKDLTPKENTPALQAEVTIPEPTVPSDIPSEPVGTPLAGVREPTAPAAVPSESVGTPLADVRESEEPPVVVMNYCMNCGKKLKPDYSFCPNCGTPRYIP